MKNSDPFYPPFLEVILTRHKASSIIAADVNRVCTGEAP